MIEKTAFVSNNNAETFYKQIRERIDEFQSERLLVEIQYSPYAQSHGEAIYTAFMIGRSNDNA